jgi:hypothetical protein
MPLHNKLKHFGDFLDFGENAKEGSNLKEKYYSNLFDALVSEVQIAVVFEFDSNPFNGLQAVIKNVGILYNEGDTRCKYDPNGVFINKLSKVKDNTIMDNIEHYPVPLFISANTSDNSLLEHYEGAIFIVHDSGALELFKEGILVDTLFDIHEESGKGDFYIYDQSKIIKSGNGFIIKFSRKSYPIFDT